MKKTLLYIDFIILPLLITFLSTHSGLISYYPVDNKNTILELNNIPKGTVTALYIDQNTSEQQTIHPSLEQKLGQFDPTYIDKATFRVDFREPINPDTFIAEDIILAGTTGTVTSLEKVSPLNENRVFEFTVTGMTAGDTVTASLEAGKVDYSNGTTNLEATSIDATVHYMGPIGCGALGLGEVITNRLNSNINLSNGDNYGYSIANIGDLNRDGITDIAVGAYGDNTGGENRGAVYIHFMNGGGSIEETKEINNDTTNGPNLSNKNYYGSSIANIGDLDGDGIVDIVVGAESDDIGGANSGAVYIHFMNDDGSGSVKETKKINNGIGTPDDSHFFQNNYYGSSIANIGDLNGDGITDIAVGATDSWRPDGTQGGAIHIHFMDNDGSVKETKKITSGSSTPNGPIFSRDSNYGSSIVNIGDLNEDGITDIAVGDELNDTGGDGRGAVYIHFMDNDGSIKATHKIASGTDVYGPPLSNYDNYGSSIANIGDINGDGITDIAVGAIGDDTGGDNRGAVYIHLMNRNASVKKTFKIDDSTVGVDLPNNSKYGNAISSMGDPNGNGTITIAVGARDVDSQKGAVYFSKIQFVCSPLPPALEQKLGQFDPTYIDKATFRVDFKEPIDPDTFMAEDIILAETTGTVTSLEKVSPLNENRVFEFTVTGMTAGDTVTASLDAGKVDYPNGTTNLEATSIDATVHYMGPIGCGALGLGEVPTNRITSNINLSNGDNYGYSIANIGDLYGDPIVDIVVGAYGDNTGGENRGAVYIHFMDRDGTVKENGIRKIASGTNDNDWYGYSIANIGDLDEDGIVDIAVGAREDDTGGVNKGAIYIHFMNDDGNVKQTRKIASGTDVYGPTLRNNDRYGSSIANIGDLNGDGIVDIVVGAMRDNTEGNSKGAVYIHFMNTNGSIKGTKEISSTTPNGPDLSNSDWYGSSIANIGDLNRDGITDIAVGAVGDNTGGNDRGIVYIHFMNVGGTIDKTEEISNTTPNGPNLSNHDNYGSSIANIGDLNGDGIPDIAVGAIGDDTGGNNRGAVYIHFMNRDGGVKKTFKIDDSTEGVNLLNNANYGRAITNMGDPDGDGNITMGVGAAGVDSNKGAVYLSDIQFICTPSLEQKLGQFDPTYIDKATFRVDFREPIDPDTFMAEDITLTNAIGTTGTTVGTVSNLRMVPLLMVSLPNENRVFEFTVTGMTAGDTVTASLDAGKVDYPNETSNIAATSIDATVHYMGPIDCGVLGLGEVHAKSLSDVSLSRADYYGCSVANIGDLDGDHIDDIAVGAYGDDTGGNSSGAVYIHFMNDNGSVKENGTHKIARGTDVNGPTLRSDDWYGYSIANIGDLDGDGIVDIAVGARERDTGGGKGVVYIHFMNRIGTIKETKKISNATPNGPNFSSGVWYGSSIVNIGDLDGDGIVDIAVGAMNDNTEGSKKGAVYIHFMNRDGTIKRTRKIASGTDDNGPDLSNDDWYGASIANIGDLDRDGITDIAVGAIEDNTGGNGRGIVYIHFMNRDGSIKETEEISSTTPNSPDLSNGDAYGTSIANIGDLNGDGITDIAVGVMYDDDIGSVYIHLMNSDGTVKKTFKIDNSTPNINFPKHALYGRAITNMGDPDGDGTITIAVGVDGLDSYKGVVYLNDIQFVCTPSLEQKLGQFDPTYIDKATFTVDFKEPINPDTFTAGDITLTNAIGTTGTTVGTVSNLRMVPLLMVPLPNENRVFEFTVTGMTAGDTVTASLPANMVEYPNGTTNLEATSIDATVRYAEPYKCGVPVFDIVSNRKIDKDAVSDISANNYYGSSIANIGDLDGDHIADIAVGAYIDNTVGTDRGAIYIHFMNSDGSIRKTEEITQGTPNGPILTDDTNYGSSIANIGDLDEDGIVDIAVGDEHNGTGGIRRGAVYIHFMNSDGSVKKTRKIASGTDGYDPNLSNYDTYGSSIANIGDLNGDGITDIAVGAGYGDTEGNNNKGIVYIHFMNSNGTVKQTQEINNNTAKGPTLLNGDLYGSSIANIGDLNGDNIIDIAVGAPGFHDNTYGDNRKGAIFIHLLKIDENGNIGIKNTFKIDDSENKPNSPYLTNGDRYGISIANMGDLDSDGVVDIAVGAVGDDITPKRETLYLHFLRTDGSIKYTAEINKNTINNSSGILQGDHYGCSIANMGDLNGDGFMDMVVGAQKTNSNNGAVYFSSFGMYCPKYMRHGKYFLNGTLRFKKSLR